MPSCSSCSYSIARRTSVLTLPLLAARRRGAQARAWPQLRSRDCSTARAVLRLWGATAVEPRDTLSTPAAATRSGGGDEGEGEGEGALGSARAAERQCGRAFYRDRRAATAGELARVWRGRGVPRGGRQRQSACRGAFARLRLRQASVAASAARGALRCARAACNC